MNKTITHYDSMITKVFYEIPKENITEVEIWKIKRPLNPLSSQTAELIQKSLKKREELIDMLNRGVEITTFNLENNQIKNVEEKITISTKNSFPTIILEDINGMSYIKIKRDNVEEDNLNHLPFALK